ncbi:hypothetical protein Cni_G27058 [Canna indica]|uniref:O-methyltransferase C-terminal domain-containing protein n=1 Tax=Canna indica TaxID=4628 RepID=A0AAQ3L0T9_9LILI|nr:hypothetical protein Cni_G27058 [Canna indica]
MVRSVFLLLSRCCRCSNGARHELIAADTGGGREVMLARPAAVLRRRPPHDSQNRDRARPPRDLGVEHISGDMFESIPSGEAIVMKWILHDWTDEHCTKILKNCWKALPEKGKVIVVECVVPVVPETTPKAQAIFQMDICMSTYNIGGKERTEEEFKALASEAGFAGFSALHVFAGYWVMEFTK